MTAPALPNFCEQCGAPLNCFGNCSWIDHSKSEGDQSVLYDFLKPHVQAVGLDPDRPLHHQLGWKLHELNKRLWSLPDSPQRKDAIIFLREIYEL